MRSRPVRARASAPGLRRKLAKAVYEMYRFGFVARRGDHSGIFVSDRRWQITPAGTDALKESLSRYYGQDNGEQLPVDDKTDSAVINGEKVD